MATAARPPGRGYRHVDDKTGAGALAVSGTEKPVMKIRCNSVPVPEPNIWLSFWRKNTAELVVG
ncbi:MAG: hypothetical protein Q4G26_02640 [Paracoccus sp. (in: a-proteobacteria)]|nr:hypothetical protein [Paracoccus sp. (in: a-proteobacteria)]